MIDQFPPSQGIYLNSGSLNKCPGSVTSAVHRYFDELEVNPTLSLMSASVRFWEVQTKVSEFFGADPKNVFLRANVTCAMNDFILGVELPKTGSIVVSDLEYGAVVNICQLRAERENRKLHTIHLKTGADCYSTPQEIVDDVVRQLPSDACLVMLSHVMTGTGLLIPIDEIGKILRAKNIRFAVDGAHGPGGVKLDFGELQNVDFYGGNLHKWFLAPKGTGFGWAHKSVQGKMRPLQGSWTTSHPVHERFHVFGGGSQFALNMLMSHTQNYAPFFALKDTVEFWQQQGAEKIRNRIYELQYYAEQTMSELFRWPLLSPVERTVRGPLLSYSLPKKLQEKGFGLVTEMWENHKVQIMVPVVQGDPCFRISPHIYNTEEEILKGLTLLKSATA